MQTTHAAAFYQYPLLIGKLLDAWQQTPPTTDIVTADLFRSNYPELQRIAQLASGLSQLGVGKGDTVAAMNWDCQRYLKCFFAIPMMGAVLHTINIRFAVEQLLYTINQARDDVILVHEDFVPSCFNQN